jgi:hypothetical protein
VQWWLGAEPAELQAFGALRRYGYNGEYRSERCMHCPYRGKCEFFWDVTKDKVAMDFYVNAESENGYLRDGCVYRRDINVWDTMTLNVRYHSGVAKPPSSACCPWPRAGASNSSALFSLRKLPRSELFHVDSSDLALTYRHTHRLRFAPRVVCRTQHGAIGDRAGGVFRARA